MLYNYITDKKKGIEWSREDVQTMQGLYSYYRMVEEKPIDAIIKHIDDKMGVDVIRMIKPHFLVSSLFFLPLNVCQDLFPAPITDCHRAIRWIPQMPAPQLLL